MATQKSTAHASKPAVPPVPVAATQPAAQAVASAPAEQPKPVQYYAVIAPKRPLTGVKFGASGNAKTHAALAAAASQHGGKLTMEQLVQVCADQHHKGFLQYAINRLKVVVPYKDQAAPSPAA